MSAHVLLCDKLLLCPMVSVGPQGGATSAGCGVIVSPRSSHDVLGLRPEACVPGCSPWSVKQCWRLTGPAVWGDPQHVHDSLSQVDDQKAREEHGLYGFA